MFEKCYGICLFFNTIDEKFYLLDPDVVIVLVTPFQEITLCFWHLLFNHTFKFQIIPLVDDTGGYGDNKILKYSSPSS